MINLILLIIFFSIFSWLIFSQVKYLWEISTLKDKFDFGITVTKVMLCVLSVCFGFYIFLEVF